MPFEVKLSQLTDTTAFDNAVKSHIRALLDFNKKVGKPRPTAHPLIESAISRVQVKGKPDSYVANYVFVDDRDTAQETPPLSLDERKNLLQNELTRSKIATATKILPDRKRLLVQLHYVEATKKLEDDRTTDDKKAVAEYLDFQKQFDALELKYAIALHALDDLTEDTVDSWQVPTFEE